MKKFALIIFFFAVALVSFSQRVYFIYLQSDNDLPFYLKMNERIYSSSSKGYLILSNLRDSSYFFSIGFPGKNMNEQQFSVGVNGKDHGYLLKNFEAKGWGLFDLQTMAVQMAKSNYSSAVEIKTGLVKKDESVFTQILAKASDDSTLLEKPDMTQIKKEEKKETPVKDVAKQPEQKIEEKKSEIKKPETLDEKKVGVVAEQKKNYNNKIDSSEVIKEDSKAKIEEKKIDTIQEKKADIVVEQKENKIDKPETITIKEEPQQKTEEIKTSQSEVYKKSEVFRKSQDSTTEGFDVTFIDEYGDGRKDTIRILIPPVKETTPTENKNVKEERKFLDIVDTSKQEVKETAKEEITKPSEGVVKATKQNNCNSIADENDFFKLRKKMAGIAEDDNMISEARKTFKGKCFTAEQIKNLSALFLSDGGKYKFFDAAYEYVSDVGNFASLQSELKSDYYINRFKAMLRN